MILLLTEIPLKLVKRFTLKFSKTSLVPQSPKYIGCFLKVKLYLRMWLWHLLVQKLGS